MLQDIGGNYLSPKYRFEQRLITKEDSVEIQKRFFDWKKEAENDGKGKPDPRKNTMNMSGFPRSRAAWIP